MKRADGLFIECCREVAGRYPDLQYEEVIVDNCMMQLVSKPQQFDVMVTPNFYGSLVSNAVAGLMGVDANRIIVAAFAIGAALAAVAGLMVSSYYGIAHYYMGFMLGLKAFTAAVLGGIGNLGGAMLGGLLLGLIESLGAGYIGDLTGGVFGSNYQDVFAFFVLIAVLMFRPSGLLGEKSADRA